MTNAPPLLVAEAVSCRIGRADLVEAASLVLRPGEMIVVVGPNGAGKSTLTRLLSGERAPSSGRVLWHGTDAARLKPAALARLRAVLPQQVTMAFPFTVEEIVRLGAEAGGHRRAAAGQLCRAVLADVDLSGWEERLYHQLSGGEQQRVQFARVLAQVLRPQEEAGTPARCLFLDEPTASLDIRHQIELLGRARAFTAGGGAVVAVVHDLNLAAEFADRLVVMEKGRIVADGPPRASLTEDTVARVFGLAGIVNRVPAGGVPYVLPQARHGPMAAAG